MNARDMKEFTGYLRNCTDAQVQGVYDKETQAGREEYATLAELEADRRGIVLQKPQEGYTDCACRDCMEIAIGVAGKAVCHACVEAGCDLEGECQAPSAYGGDSVCEHGNWLCSTPGCENNTH